MYVCGMRGKEGNRTSAGQHFKIEFHTDRTNDDVENRIIIMSETENTKHQASLVIISPSTDKVPLRRCM